MKRRLIGRSVHAGGAVAVPDGLPAFFAGIALLAVPTVAMVASATAPTERGHWVVVLMGVALAVYGALRGIREVGSGSA